MNKGITVGGIGVFSRGRGRRTSVLIVMLLVGAIVGSAAGQALADWFPILARTADFGFTPTTFDLAGALSFTLGLSLRINLATILGIALALMIYRRL